MIKKFLLVLALMVETVYFIHAQHEHYLTQTKISDELYYSSITDSIFMITHYFPYWGGNSMFVLLPHKKGVLIDTPFKPRERPHCLTGYRKITESWN